ncbi:TPA: acetolactate decarboxylase [Vibrio cholerae]|uniref:acetolactate decarboxylase n=1 Tax=Vibrio cholerae TaxID=666 RepID=UPI0011581AFB|nr:acetolactate decarboxylase [Vibrio cholerae]EGR4343057.1 acetolactate decarboxylase [Vibrio cholerae]EII2377330.1 acetolactate decarboxylase [Vibrio cholerae]EJL6654582.1 acetolactate decarboxylase [Vibrio cholerae]EJL6914091.1 acetolactate decarboxylase [Vibrio cholerae]EJL8266528.1 acetolactate decarboxylase [Vibrio cholerae]
MNPLLSAHCSCSQEIAQQFAHYQHISGEGEIYQTSLMSALIAGVYEGATTIAQLLEHGDFGLGTFNELDGELIAFDRQVFQLRADGSAQPAHPEQQTPFAVFTFFKADIELPITERMTREQVHQLIDRLVPSDNLFCAIRIDGTFPSVQTRTVPKQQRPYRPMLEVVKQQPVFRFQRQHGVIAGFRSPQYTTGINVPGYHEHFITQQRTGGGHIQDYIIRSGFLQIGRVSRLVVDTPVSRDFLEANLTPNNIRAAIEAAEK